MIYINGSANISPQPTANKKDFLTDIRAYNTNMLQCIEPDYSKFYHANALRRIGRILKLGWAAAKTCLGDAGIKTPDAICIGTGKGCYKNTQRFLFSINENNEQFVPPSPFIQSAHGSIAAQIAIQTGCKNYNMTYSHRTFSFESALLDAMMIIKEGKFNNVLVGGVDEIEDIQFQTFNRIGHYKKPDSNNLKIIDKKSAGTIAGEGSAFFLLENEPNKTTLAVIKSIHTFSNPKNKSDIAQQINSFLKSENLSIKDIDLVLLGLNGNIDYDWVYKDLMESFLSDNCQAYYKHLCGEYHTSSAFALWVAANSIYRQHIPDVIRLNNKPRKALNNILIYNHYRNVNHSLILISK